MAPLRPRCTPPLRHRAPPNVAMAAAMLTAEGRGAQGDGGVRVGARAMPKELRMVESQKLEEKAKKTKEADAGAAVARACGVINK